MHACIKNLIHMKIAGILKDQNLSWTYFQAHFCDCKICMLYALNINICAHNAT